MRSACSRPDRQSPTANDGPACRPLRQAGTEAYADQTAHLRTLITNFDGSANAAGELANTLTANKTAAYEFATAIQQIGAQLDQLSTDQAKSIRESVMTEEELRAARTKERDFISAMLPGVTDPTVIAEATQRILELNRQLFDTLPEELRAERAEAFASYAENTGMVAQNLLDATLSTLQTTQESINQQVNQMLSDTAARQQQAANTMVGAANSFAQTVASLQAQGITVTVSRGSEVNV